MEPGGLWIGRVPLGVPRWRAPSDRLGRVVAGHLKVTYLHPLPFGSRNLRNAARKKSSVVRSPEACT